MKRVLFFISLILFSMLAGLGLLRPASAAAAGANLVTNPSAETTLAGSTDPVGWSRSSWGANTPVYSVKATGQSGTRSLFVSMTGYTNGDAKWAFDPVPVTAGTTYVFSDYYKASITTDVVADYTDAAGNDSYEWLGSPAATTAWAQTGYTLTAPVGTVKMTVLHVISGAGTLQTDSFYLGTPTAPVVTNGVPNASMEQVSDANAKQPLAWQSGNWGTNTVAYSYATTGYDGTRSLKTTVSRYTDGDAKWYFKPVTVSPGTQYVYADYYKSGVATAMVAQYELADGTTSYADLGTIAVSTAWKRAAVLLTAPANAKTVTILHLIKAVGSLQIDQASLLPETQLATTNGVPNSSLEQTSLADQTKPLAWTTGKWGTNTVSYSYSAVAHTGAHAVKTQISKYTDGDAKWYYAEQPVVAGQSYTLSDWYQSTITSQVVVQITNTDGTQQYLHLPTANAASSWTQYSAKVTMPATAKSATILHLIAGVGYLITDDYSLVPVATVGFNRGLVSLTFDDGWGSIYTNAIPLLDAHGYKSTQYIVSGFIDTPSYMTSAMLNSMFSDGQEIASHTVTHPDLTTLTGAQLVTELHDSQAFLLSHGLGSVNDFATPYGAYNSTVIAAIKQYYASHRSTDVGYNSKDSFDPYNLKVQDLSVTTTETELQSWLDKAKADKTWLILVFHQIDTSGEQYSSTPAQLARYLDDIAARNLPVVTVSGGIGEVSPQL